MIGLTDMNRLGGRFGMATRKRKETLKLILIFNTIKVSCRLSKNAARHHRVTLVVLQRLNV